MLMISCGHEEAGDDPGWQKFSILGPIISKVALADNTQPAGERRREKRGLFKKGLYLPGLKKHSTLLLNFLWPYLNHTAIPNARRAGKHKLVRIQEKRKQAWWRANHSLKGFKIQILGHYPRWSLLSMSNRILKLKLANWFWCMPNLGITGLGSKEIGANKKNMSMESIQQCAG